VGDKMDILHVCNDYPSENRPLGRVVVKNNYSKDELEFIKD